MRDRDIRTALREYVGAIHDPAATVVVDELELCLGAARVDLAVVNGTLHGYEIKSEADTLARLPAQATAYNRVFERVTIVCSRRHLPAVRKVIPRWWGILAADVQAGQVRLAQVRRDQRNPRIDHYAQAQLLWRSEALDALAQLELADGMRHKPRKLLWQKLATQSPETVTEVVRESLKARSNWRAASQP